MAYAVLHAAYTEQRTVYRTLYTHISDTFGFAEPQLQLAFGGAY